MDAPYFPFYPADWLSDSNVQQLTLEESGAYITLLAHMWNNGNECRIPDDDKTIARILHISTRKWLTLRKVLIDGPMPVLHKTGDGYLFNKRLDLEHQTAMDKLQKRSDAANKRWSGEVQKQSKSSANAMQMDMQVGMQNDAIKDPDTDTDKRSSGGGDHAYARVDDAEVTANRMFEQTYGRPPNDIQRYDLATFINKGMESALIHMALVKARRKDRDPGYALAILQKQFDRGVRTVTDAEIDDAKFEIAVGVNVGGANRGSRASPSNKVKHQLTDGRVGRV